MHLCRAVRPGIRLKENGEGRKKIESHMPRFWGGAGPFFFFAKVQKKKRSQVKRINIAASHTQVSGRHANKHDDINYC